jgi:hypothetical protein
VCPCWKDKGGRPVTHVQQLVPIPSQAAIGPQGRRPATPGTCTVSPGHMRDEQGHQQRCGPKMSCHDLTPLLFYCPASAKIKNSNQVSTADRGRLSCNHVSRGNVASAAAMMPQQLNAQLATFEAAHHNTIELFRTRASICSYTEHPCCYFAPARRCSLRADSSLANRPIDPGEQTVTIALGPPALGKAHD